MRVVDALKYASRTLDESGIPDARLESSSLLAFAIGQNRTFLIAHPEYELSEIEKQKYDAVVNRRAGREPFHYIIGSREFYGLDFRLSPDVLIPRPETELLVECALPLLQDIECPRFLELGTGSGCISISILKNNPRATVVGTDVCIAALDITNENAIHHAVSSRMTLIRSDLFSAIPAEEFDLIVSNPPYIAASDLATLEPEVRDHEPSSALTDGSDGLSLIRRIVLDSHSYLRPEGSLIMEFGYGQSAAVESMFEPSIWERLSVRKDMNGIDRVVIATTRK